MSNQVKLIQKLANPEVVLVMEYEREQEALEKPTAHLKSILKRKSRRRPEPSYFDDEDRNEIVDFNSQKNAQDGK
jgi:hypothetical protein